MEAHEDLDSFIASTVKKYWEDNKSAFLLSALGTMLRQRFPSRFSSEKFRLQDHLRELATVRVVQHPSIQAQIGAVPSTAPELEDQSDYFKKPVRFNDIKPIYRDDFWKAFVASKASRRFVQISDDGTILIVDLDSAPQGNAYEVSENDISKPPLGATTPEKVAETHRKIESWLNRNGLTADQFFQDQSKQYTRQNNTNKLLQLVEVLKCLTPTDQARLSMPVDILVALSLKR